MVPPIQPGVVGPYLVLGTWLLSHLSPERTGRIQIFCPYPVTDGT
jgi:hypothetical protein